MKKIAIALSSIFSLTQGENIVFVHQGPSDSTSNVPFFAPFNKGAQDAALLMGVNLETIVMGETIVKNKLVTLMEQAISKKPDAIVASFVNPAMKPMIEKALSKNITVVAVNGNIDLLTRGYTLSNSNVEFLPEETKCEDVKSMYQNSKCCENPDLTFKSSATLLPPDDALPIQFAGQNEKIAGMNAGIRAKAEGATESICLNPESFANQLVQRCEGYGEHVMTHTPNIDDAFATFSMLQNWPGDTLNDPLLNRTIHLMNTHSSANAILAVTPVQCLYAATIITAHNLKIWNFLSNTNDIHIACFDTFPSPQWFDNIRNNVVSFTIDQGAYIQTFQAVTMAVNEMRHGIVNYAPILTGPKFIDKSNVDEAQKASLSFFL